jgi:hypothetical protein
MPLTLAQMTALFPDNTAGDISAQDGRDVITGLYEWGAPFFADEPNSAIDVSEVTDQSIFSTNVTGLAAGDLLMVELWGFSNNGSGGNRTLTFTLDFDTAFDMEWPITTVSTAQGWRLTGLLSIHASNHSTLHLTGIVGNQVTVGTMTGINTTGTAQGYDTTTQDLTGTTAVTLVARSNATTATQDITVLGVVIRKITST